MFSCKVESPRFLYKCNNVWSREEIQCLIGEYQKHPCLYAVKTKVYKNKHARTVALQAVVDALKPLKKDITATEIRNKFNALKTNFMNEHRRAEASAKSSAGDDDIYVPTLWYYKHMLFVLEHNIPRKSYDSIGSEAGSKSRSLIDVDEELENNIILIKNEENEILFDDSGNIIQDIPIPTSSPIQFSRPASEKILVAPGRSAKKSKRRKSDSENEEIFTNAIKTMTGVIAESSQPKQQKTPSDVFGEYVAHRLNVIPQEHIRLKIEGELTNVLHKAIEKYCYQHNDI